MKIHQLPYGARFEYEGEEYVKTGPMFATGKDGQRVIPRHSVLKPVNEIQAPCKKNNDLLPRADVFQAFESFYTVFQMLVPEDRQAEVEAGRDRFLKSLG